MTELSQNWTFATDAGYDDASLVYSSVHQARPRVVAGVGSIAEVRQALAYARSEGLPVAVRGGGHSLAGLSTIANGLVIDLRKFNGIEPAERLGEFWIGGGAVAGQVATYLGDRGLAVPLGDSASVGIGGITLGGGTGWLTRKFGLTLDSLTGAEVVLADGSSSIVDEVENPDLFWALRGGGGNFGVVTRLRFRPRELPSILGGTMTLPLSAQTLRRVIDTVEAAPDDLGIIALAMRPPNAATPVLMLTLVWCGLTEEGERVIARLRAIAPPVGEDISQMPYAGMYRFAFGEPPTIGNATENILADVLDDEGLAAVVGAANAPPVEGVFSVVEIRVLGGAMARVPVDATAFAHRGRKLSISVVRVGFPVNSYEEHRAWVKASAKPMHHLRKGVYLNFIERYDTTTASLVYPGGTAERLAAIKLRVDPQNLFARNLPLIGLARQG
jgi:FAD/FMN-containing dehydrogenase